MENAASALKTAFAMFVFVVALSIAFFLLTEIRQTANTLLWYSDNTNYWPQPMEGSNERIVGVDTVISSLTNREIQSSYVTIIENEEEYTYKQEDDEVAKQFIKEHISGTKSRYTYKETIREITMAGEYKTANDGTRISTKPGIVTRRYIVYEKQ